MNVKFISICILFLISICNVFGENNPKAEERQKKQFEILNKRIDSLKSQLDVQSKYSNELEKKLEYQTEQINNQAGMLDTAFDGVSTEISASSNYISIFGVIIALVSIALGWYVTQIEKSIKSMNDDSEILTQRNIEIKQSVEALSEKITKDSKGLYNIIRNEESNHILDRLISVPEDIDNLFFSIAARDFQPEHYLKLKEAYLQLKEDPEYNKNYMTLLFQHFSGLWPFDEDVKDEVTKFLYHTFEYSYKNDILKTSRDFFTALSDSDFVKFKSEINSFVKALCESKFKSNKEIYSVIDQTMNTKEMKFKLYNLIEKIPESLIFRKEFGNLIIEHNFENPTESEIIIIEEIKKLN